jgi:hypothetical protein
MLSKDQEARWDVGKWDVFNWDELFTTFGKPPRRQAPTPNMPKDVLRTIKRLLDIKT